MNKSLIFVALVVMIGISQSSFVNKFMTEKQWKLNKNAKINDQEFSFRVSLHQNNLDVIDQLLNTVSDPANPRYGQFLTAEEIADIVKQDDAEINKVHQWIYQNLDFTVCKTTVELTAHKDHINVKTCLSQLKNIFPNAEFASFNHPEYKGALLRTAEQLPTDENFEFLNVPAELHTIIKSIHGVTDLPVVSQKQVQSYTYKLKQQGQSVSPSVIAKEYGIDYTKTITTQGPQSSQAVAEFQQQYYSESDLKSFYQQTGVKENLIDIVGSNDQSQPGVESMLDIEYIAANQVYTETIYFDNFDLVAWGQSIAGNSSSPRVHSISYGESEDKYDSATIQSANTEFQKLGLQGYSVLIASGDSGPYPRQNCFKYSSAFPAASPYVTAVGATYMSEGSSEEVSTSFSGGGFSKIFKRPSYQDEAVTNYLSTASGLPSHFLYHKDGRATPDVSAFGTNFEVIVQGQTQSVAGTSASCPLFASMIALINVQRQEQGKGPLGFLNPALYKLKNVGYDVTSGKNSNGCFLGGFPAAPGYDAVSGLGAPRFQTLSEGLLNVESKFQATY